MKLLATTFCDILSTASTAASPFRPSQRNVSTWSSVLVIVVDSQPHAAREKEILERVQEIGGYGNVRCGYWQGEAVVGGEGNRGSERVRTDSSIRTHDASYGIPSPETNPVKSPLLSLCTSRRAARIKGSSNREWRRLFPTSTPSRRPPSALSDYRNEMCPLRVPCRSSTSMASRTPRGKEFFSSGSRRSEDMEAQGVGIGERKRYWGERTTE